jgi:hypothetical protein
MVCELLHGLVTIFRNNDGNRTAGTDFLNVGHDLGVQGITAARRRNNHEDRLSLLYKSNRAMLKLSSGKAFSMQIRNLL